MGTIRFSIIIPVYNTDIKYLSKCIASCMQQNYNNYEIILVNDCSTKKATINYLKTLDKKIKIVNNKSNLGLGPSRNIGIENSKGDYILFVDSDDFIEKDTLNTLSSLNILSYDLVSFNFRSVNPSNKTENNEDYYYKIGRNKVWGGGTTWTKAYKTDFIKVNKISFHNSRLYHEDEYFTMSCLRFSPKIKYIDNIFYNYSIDVKESITNNLKIDKSFNDIALWLKDLRITKDDNKVLRKWYTKHFSLYFINYLIKSQKPNKEIFIKNTQSWKANYSCTLFKPIIIKFFYKMLLLNSSLNIIFFIATKMFKRKEK